MIEIAYSDRPFLDLTSECQCCSGIIHYREKVDSDQQVTRVCKLLNGVKVEVITGLRSWNSANLCVECIIKILQESQPTPSVRTTNNHKTTTVFMTAETFTMAQLSEQIIEEKYITET